MRRPVLAELCCCCLFPPLPTPPASPLLPALRPPVVLTSFFKLSTGLDCLRFWPAPVPELALLPAPPLKLPLDFASADPWAPPARALPAPPASPEPIPPPVFLPGPLSALPAAPPRTPLPEAPPALPSAPLLLSPVALLPSPPSPEIPDPADPIAPTLEALFRPLAASLADPAEAPSPPAMEVPPSPEIPLATDPCEAVVEMVEEAPVCDAAAPEFEVASRLPAPATVEVDAPARPCEESAPDPFAPAPPSEAAADAPASLPEIGIPATLTIVPGSSAGRLAADPPASSPGVLTSELDRFMVVYIYLPDETNGFLLDGFAFLLACLIN
mmetsp:Transcript_6575/g.13304  ORF Transcript_6575/g.13304 Transcript_6575/m.13304 type:complete len:328 (-) Transcript_6575:898-1881(-)